MAKKAKKESGLPVVIALVFFVLLSVGLGVFCYVLYSDQEAKDKAVVDAAKKEKGAAAEQKKAELQARLYRLVIGIQDQDDRDVLTGESKPGDEYVAELKKINETIEKRLAGIAQADKSAPLKASDVLGWAPDNDNKLTAGPTKYIIDSAAKAIAEREVAKIDADGKKKEYDDAAEALKKREESVALAETQLANTAKAISDNIKKTLDDLSKKTNARIGQFDIDIKGLQDKIDVQLADLTRSRAETKQLGEVVMTLKTDLAGRDEAKKKGEQFFDEPLGRITRRLPDDTIEIDIGTSDKAKPGLTFTVLPADFPVKGYQSRVRTFRVPDDRGVFREQQRFVEKANIEIIDVLGPHSSKARIVSETDGIRDRILAGDLLYNVAWRRGYTDHVALYGLFDINGDGSDDIKNIVRDFDKMGIPVDAYFDLKEKKWVGELTNKTRYVISGYMPSPRGQTDPFVKEKAELNDALSKAREEAKQKGLTVVDFRDIFPRMGYRVRLDVSDDKIQQATSQYIQSVGNAPAAPAPNN
jgi:hypothetical protein